MKLRMIALLAVATMAFGLMTVPAGASDVGFGRDLQALVGKTGAVDANCSTTPSGGGLGYPVDLSGNLAAAKNAYWKISGTVTSLLGNAVKKGNLGGAVDGTLVACGKVGQTLDNLTGTLNAPGLGAWCGMSKGVGQGKVTFPNSGLNVTLSNLVWKISAGSLFVVYADAATVQGPGTLLAVVSAKGVAAECLRKSQGDKTQPTTFQTDFVYALVNADTPHPNSLPGLDKCGSCPLFGPKKTS